MDAEMIAVVDILLEYTWPSLRRRAIRFQRRRENSTQETMICASVRRKGSTDPCTSRSLVGHTLCGVHARCKAVTLWADVNQSKVRAVYRIQAHVRGWLLRRRLALAGPGVLRRRDLANDEDLETCEDASRQSPLDYVAFTENGKTWWFDFATLWKWAQTSVESTNPYTKVPLSADTRYRLRKLWSARKRRGEVIPSESPRFEDRLRARWTTMCQVFEDCGFGTIQPEIFLRMTRNDYIVMLRMLRDDLSASFVGKSVRFPLSMIHRCLVSAWSLSTTHFILQSSYALYAMLLHAKQEAPLAFCILAAIYRL